MAWTTFADALFCLLTFAFAAGRPCGFEESRELLNVLVMESIRIQAEDFDYLKLKDTLKLGMRFKATFPIDKVYGLLGIVEERYTPLFHPKYSTPDSFKEGVDPTWYTWKDIMLTQREISDTLETLSGRRKTRKGRATLSSSRRVLRHVAGLKRDFAKLWQRLIDGKGNSALYVIQPDYSEKTPESVYTTVARDLIKEEDPFSFLCHAGIGLTRNLQLSNLPSWVPDWSTDPDNYLLPRLRGQTENLKQSRAKESKGPENIADAKKILETAAMAEAMNKLLGGKITEETKNQIVRDEGPKFLHIKATIVGSIEHLAILSEDLKPSGLENEECAREDFHCLFSNYMYARTLACEQTISRYSNREAVINAFYRTILADTDSKGNSPVPTDVIDFWRNWTLGIWERCHIRAALQPGDYKHYWSNTTDEGEKRECRDAICEKYLFRRRMQSSANAKFAHLVRTEIAPSFAKYRYRPPKTDEENKTKNEMKTPLDEEKKSESEQVMMNRVSMLDDSHAGPLAGYLDYVDYTIGRKFAITNTEFMGLVPAGAEEGDLVVFIEQENLFFTLRREQYVDPEQAEKENKVDGSVAKASKGKATTDSADVGDSNRDETFRLVGQSYIHDWQSGLPRGLDCEEEEEEEEEEEREIWFKIW